MSLALLFHYLHYLFIVDLFHVLCCSGSMRVGVMVLSYVYWTVHHLDS